MSVVSVEKDLDSLSLTLVADFDRPTRRPWSGTTWPPAVRSPTS